MHMVDHCWYTQTLVPHETNPATILSSHPSVARLVKIIGCRPLYFKITIVYKITGKTFYIAFIYIFLQMAGGGDHSCYPCTTYS